MIPINSILWIMPLIALMSVVLSEKTSRSVKPKSFADPSASASRGEATNACAIEPSIGLANDVPEKFQASLAVFWLIGAVKELIREKPMFQVENFDDEFVQKLVYDALVWCSLHGLVVGDKTYQKSGTVPGVGMTHAPIALLPTPFLESYWKQACEVTPIFNELIDRNEKADIFTSRLVDIHSNHSFGCDCVYRTFVWVDTGFGRLVTELHQSLLRSHGDHLGLDSERVPKNTSKAWLEYNNPSDGQEVSVVYYRISIHLNQLLIEQSSAVKCPSIA
ncbi:hypothetical protein DY000_02048464 [Brassica cretica]|uniref:Glutathione synthase substrate-binding domain-containing protein n=1 Tax=Brassica cretica TaxID=69181 RepID=A0ABQ7EVR8_BRACR|nr:hypothetical protein DY000_02048464 [Brassica cretica]